MHVVTQLDEARQRHADAVRKMEDWNAKCQDTPEDASQEEIDFFRNAFLAAKAECARWAEQVEQLEAISKARRQIEVDTPEDKSENGNGGAQPERSRIAVAGEPLTYTERSGTSFFSDLYMGTARGDSKALARLDRHMHEMKVEQRDLTTGDPGGGGFIPPIYLADRWVNLPRPRRPFADASPKIPLNATGMVMTFPRIQTGTAVAVQATENNAVQETDLDAETYTVDIRTIAGQNDISRQLLERSDPGMDEVIFSDLIRAYDSYLDAQLLFGAGTSGTHRGLRNVTGINTVTFSSGTADALIKKIYDAIQQIATNAYDQANLIVMHPRRSAWIASFQGSVFPLLQQGGLMQAQGTQDNGFVGTIAGLPVIADPNMATTLGAGTNEDEIFVVVREQQLLAEGPLRTDTFRDVLSGTLTVRLQVSAYSAFVGGRVPKTITKISGAGLVTPTF